MDNTKGMKAEIEDLRDDLKKLRALAPLLSDFTPAGRDALLEPFPMERDHEVATSILSQCR